MQNVNDLVLDMVGIPMQPCNVIIDEMRTNYKINVRKFNKKLKKK